MSTLLDCVKDSMTPVRLRTFQWRSLGHLTIRLSIKCTVYNTHVYVDVLGLSVTLKKAIYGFNTENNE